MTLITCVSSITYSKIKAIGIPQGKIVILNNPVDTNMFQIKQIEGIKVHLAFVGRLDENKGIIRCFEAFRRISPKYNYLRLLVIGDGSQRKDLEELLTADPEIKSRVEITGFIEKEQIAKLLKSCLFLVAPSIVESFGIAVAEAMSCGLPVVVGKNNGTSDYVDDNVGRIIDSEDVTQISDAMEWIINNYDSYDPYIIRSKIVKNFSFEITGEKLEKLYNSLI